MEMFDAHCHLQEDVLFPNLGKIMERAAAVGVVRMAVCGTLPKDWPKVFQCMKKSKEFFSPLGKEKCALTQSVGIHPWFVSKDWKKEFQSLEKDASMLSVGIGECGLDFQKRFTNRAEQEECFRAHLDLATTLDRPVAVHCVQAWGRMLEILRDYPKPKKILHAFGGAAELIPELTELNCWFSFCGNVTNPNAKRVRAAVVEVPDDRLLVETDAPDFPPLGCSKPNEPANLIHVVRAVSEFRKEPVEQIAALTFANAERLFQ